MLKFTTDSISYIKTPEGFFVLIMVILTIITIIVTIHFGIRSSKKPHENIKDTRKAGVIDEGIGSTYENCEGIGLDAGLISKGKGLRSVSSKWKSIDEAMEIQNQKFEERARRYPDPRDSAK